MKRRTFIFGASAASLDLASVGGVFWRRNYLARKGVELLRKRITLGELTQQIGEAYLEANPKSSEWSLFAEIVGPRKLEEGWREDGGEKLAGHVQWFNVAAHRTRQNNPTGPRPRCIHGPIKPKRSTRIP